MVVQVLLLQLPEFLLATVVAEEELLLVLAEQVLMEAETAQLTHQESQDLPTGVAAAVVGLLAGLVLW
jgi:hypothetical protein